MKILLISVNKETQKHLQALFDRFQHWNMSCEFVYLLVYLLLIFLLMYFFKRRKSYLEILLVLITEKTDLIIIDIFFENTSYFIVRGARWR